MSAVMDEHSPVYVAQLFRYPVKGLSPQAESSVAIVAGEGLPGDRRFALALGGTKFDPAAPEPLDKGHFRMLRRDTALASLRTHFDPGSERLTIVEADGTEIVADLRTEHGRTITEDFFHAFLGGDRPHLVEAPGHKFTDVSVISPEMMRAVSMINLASVRELSARCGTNLDPRRFRANLYIDGLTAWKELDWVGREVAIGSTRLRCVLRTKRCAAVDVDPVTARRDTHLPKDLMRNYGHPDCGIYLEVIEGGLLRIDDKLHVLPES